MGHAAQPLRHQGQAPEYSAVLRVSRDLALARSLLQPLPQQTESHHLGSLSEVVDGNPPFTLRGCIAQVRSVAEARRVREEIGRCLQVPI